MYSVPKVFEIKKDFNDLIVQGFGAKWIRKSLGIKYAGKTDLLTASIGAFKTYIALHKTALLQSAEIYRGLVVSAKADVQDLKEAATVVVSTNPVSTKQQALTKLFNRVEARLAVIEEQQRKNPLDPKIETVFALYIKESRVLLSSIDELQAEINKEEQDKYLKELGCFVDCLLTLQNQIYEKIHGKKGLDQFHNELEKYMGAALKKYQTEGSWPHYGVPAGIGSPILDN